MTWQTRFRPRFRLVAVEITEAVEDNSAAGAERRGRRLRRAAVVAAIAVLGCSAIGMPATARPRQAPAKAAPAAAPAPPPWEQPFSGDPAAIARAAAHYEGHEGDPVVVLFSDQRFSLDAEGRETYTQRLVYRIVTASADTSWSTVERSWAPWHQARPEVRARVITAEGVAHTLDPAMLTEAGEAQDDPEMFGDGRVLRGPLPATGPGAVVEQEVTLHDTSPFFDGGVVDLIDVAASVSVLHARVVIEAPAEVPLRTKSRLLPVVTPREEHIDGPPALRRLTFEYHDLPASEDPEAGLPPEVPRTPYLAFSTGSSWADVARRYSAVVDQAIAAPAPPAHGGKAAGGELAAWIRGAGGSAPSQLETIGRVLRRLGEVRYTGVELGQGGIVPRPPVETLHRRFGDCKDKAVLLVAALRHLDIPAYVALLNAGEDDHDIDAELPGFGGFNHAIVVVPGNPLIWIDPTDRFARAGELPPDDQGRMALIASPVTSGLTRTPEAESAENRSVKTLDFVLADHGAARAIETADYWGVAERDLRAFYTSEDPDLVRESLAEYMRKTYFAKSLAAFDHANPLDLSRPFHLRLEAREAKRAMTDDAGAAVAVLTAPLLDQLPDEITGRERDRQSPARQGPFYFTRPFRSEITYRIVPPVGFAPRPLPLGGTRHLGTVTLEETYAAAPDGVVTATLRLDTGQRRINAAEFEQLRAAVHALAEARPDLVQFEQVGEAALAAGRVHEAIEEFSREAAASPKKALPHCRLARALLAGGLGEAARTETERAVRLEPRSGLAERTRGWALEHDAVGRRFAPGYDRGGALAAFRKAKSLDAEDETARLELAVLLEHDGEGRRYGAGSDLAAAIAEYRELRHQNPRAGVDDHLMSALLHAGRFAELNTLAAEIDETPSRDSLRMVALAATASATAAIRDGEHRLRDPATLVAALELAAQELIALRHYGEAAALLQRAAQQSPNAAAFLARADALRRARRHEDLAANDDPGRPAGAARNFLLAALGEPPAGARMLSMLSQGLNQALGSEGRRQMVDAPGRGLREAPRPGSTPLSADVRQDLVLAAWHEAVQGSDAAGYRVEISSAYGEVAGRTALFLVPESGGYRIAALGDFPATLGYEAARRLAAHDLAGARQWLDWAAEEERNSPPAPAGALAEADEDPAAPAVGAATDDGSLPAVPLVALWGRRASERAGDSGVSSTAGDDPSLVTAARCAAASLAAEALGSPVGPTRTSSEATLATLKSCGSEPGSEWRRLAVEVALARAYHALGRHAEMLESCRRLSAARPDSQIAFGLTAAALASLARWSELEALAARRLATHPGDPASLRAAARAAIERGNVDQAAASLRQVVDSGRESAADLAELAWLALARGQATEQAIDDAQRAAALSRYRDPQPLETLATLYAEAGHPAEAYRIALQAMAARPSTDALLAPPTDADWYVFGHLAESYGLPPEARRLYARVRPGRPGEADPHSPFRLAQARLAALNAAGTAPAAAVAVSHGSRR